MIEAAVILIDNSPSMHQFIADNSSKLINDIIKPLNDISRVDILALDDLSYIYFSDIIVIEDDLFLSLYDQDLNQLTLLK